MENTSLVNLSYLEYLIVLILISLGTYYYWIFQRNKYKKSDSVDNGHKVLSLETNVITNQTKPGFINAMKSGGRNIVVFYGSQTGTAEEFSTRLAKEAVRYGMRAMPADPDRCDMNELTQLSTISNSLAIFCVSTYWEGDPTDNAMAFHNWLLNGDKDLTGLRYTVFGLGNSTYEYFNKMGKYVDSRLEQLGAQRLHGLGLGDTANDIDNYFDNWKDKLWQTVCKQFNVRPIGEGIDRQYRLILHTDIPREQLFTGEVYRLNSLVNQKPPFNPKNPFLAPVLVNRELYKGLRSCLHIELDLLDSQLSYEAGDYVAVYQQNDTDLVEMIGQLLDTDLDEVISLDNVDEDSFKRHPFPCPTTYRTALVHYTDISSSPKINVLRQLSKYATNEDHKTFLEQISAATDEGKQLYSQWITDSYRSIVDVLKDLPSVRPPLDHLLELLPRLLPRFYTIGSSSKVHPNSIHLAAVVVDKSTGRINKGMATNQFRTGKSQQSGHKLLVPIYIRRSQFRLPTDPKTPVIMIGPGSGFASFRGFIEERWYLKQQGLSVGQTILYFGCQKSTEDFLYADEVMAYLADNTLTKLYTAFSREDPNHKIYVTDLMRQNMPELWTLLGLNSGHIYVSGYASTVARDVKDILIDTFVTEGNQSAEEAINYLKLMESQRRYLSDVWS